MKFEVGRFYRTRGGRKIKILEVGCGPLGMLIGYCEADGTLKFWPSHGQHFSHESYLGLELPDDLIAEWEEPEKKVTITKSQLFAATETIVRNWGMDWRFHGYDRSYHISEMGPKFLLKLLVPLIKELGLEDK